MATIRRFEDLEVWQEARILNKEIIPVLRVLKLSRDYALKEQLDDACGSCMDNIAEGFERGGNRELIQFLALSKGSLGEVRSQLYRISDRQMVPEPDLDELQKRCLVLASKLARFMDYLSRTAHNGPKYRSSENKKQETRNKKQDPGFDTQ